MSVSNVVYDPSPSIFPVLFLRESHQSSSLGRHALFPREIMQIEREDVFFLSYFQTKSSCVSSLISGIAASFFTANPLPGLLGLSGCLPGVFAQHKIGNEFQVNTYTLNYQEFPSVISLDNENFVVMWSSFAQDRSGYGIYGQLFAENSSKIGNEFRVNTNWVGNQERSSLTTLGNGNFVVIWKGESDGSSWGIFGQLFNRDTIKIGLEFRVNSYTNFSQEAPSVASLNSGNFVVTWQSENQDGSAFGIYGQMVDGMGVNFGNEFQVNT